MESAGILRSYGEVYGYMHRLRRQSMRHDPAVAARVAPAAAYGFVVFVVSWAGLAAFLAWALMPGLLEDWLPSRYWAVAGPTWCCVSLVMLPIVYRLASIILQSPAPDARDDPPAPPFDAGDAVPPLEVVQQA